LRSSLGMATGAEPDSLGWVAVMARRRALSASGVSIHSATDFPRSQGARFAPVCASAPLAPRAIATAMPGTERQLLRIQRAYIEYLSGRSLQRIEP
jgi:hypothetical protein